MAAALRRRVCYPIVRQVLVGEDIAWEVSESLSREASAEIWQACANAHEPCEHILKYIPFYESKDADKFESEVRIQSIAATKNVAPEILDAWTCSTGGALVMPKLIETLNDRWNNIDAQIVNTITAEKFAPKLIALIDETATLVHKLHDMSIMHNDIHEYNLMYNAEDQLQFIDFGQSTISSEDEADLVDNMQFRRMFRMMCEDIDVLWLKKHLIEYVYTK